MFVTSQLASVSARKVTVGHDAISVLQVTMATLVAGLATAVKLAVPPLCVMLRGNVPVCTTLLDEHVTNAALVTTSILNVFVSIKCLKVYFSIQEASDFRTSSCLTLCRQLYGIKVLCMHVEIYPPMYQYQNYVEYFNEIKQYKKNIQ